MKMEVQMNEEYASFENVFFDHYGNFLLVQRRKKESPLPLPCCFSSHQHHDMNKDLFFMCMLLTMNDREIDSNQAQ